MTTPFTIEIPRYQCHKKVQALKIKAVIPNPRGYELHFDDSRFCPIEVGSEWYRKHALNEQGPLTNLVGGYAVWYEDGYMSWSPAEAFESGYTPVGDARLTLARIESVIVGEEYIQPSGTITICILTLKNGAKVIGKNYGAIDPARQVWEQGRDAARREAIEKVWELEGYLLRERISS